MNKDVASKFHYSYQFGMIFSLLGAIAIYLQIVIALIFTLAHSILDVVPAETPIDPTQRLYYILFLSIGIPSCILFMIATRKYVRSSQKGWGILGFFLFILASLGFNASLMFGGGWYAGIVIGDLGLCALLNAMIHHHRYHILDIGSLTDSTKRTHILTIKRSVAIMVCIIIVVSGLIPFISSVSSISGSLMNPSQSIQGITPNHDNTFYILPIWEEQGENMSDQIGQLNYIKAAVGGSSYTGTGFVQIGRSVSCWYTNDIYDNGSYNPTNLIADLQGCALTNTTILFHMNGGNWGQGSSSNPVIEAMRENVSNCQWDQKNVCPPIQNENGPNNRFWSLANGTDWENYRETNIKDALAIIHAWWEQYPTLLVGFSTDSEIHEEDNTFQSTNPGNYSSYFDYNNVSIAQFRQWVQSNWSLTTFNQLCGTSFTAWNNVDAPRDASIVGKVGNPYWETWTNFRIWQVQQAVMRQCEWINESGFPRDMIWTHQILSSPGDTSARYVRCDPIETASNPYCQPGVTSYGWVAPTVWNSLGQLSINDGSGVPLPSWGIFEWNLWTQHDYWAYMDMLDCMYQYGGHVICPNEWDNSSSNTGLWIPGYNIQLLGALKNFVSQIQAYPRGTSPHVQINSAEIGFYNTFNLQYALFSRGIGLIIMGGVWLLCLIYWIVAIPRVRKKVKETKVNESAIENSEELP